jgi:uncharacterized protein YeeX (DUF496 family)
MLSRQYLETVRTLIRVARNIADQKVADRLKALAEDYERRVDEASRRNAKNAAALRRRVLSPLTGGSDELAVQPVFARHGPGRLK